MRTTHTYALVEVSQSAFDEVKRQLDRAGYENQIHQDGESTIIDMHGLALIVEPKAIRVSLDKLDPAELERRITLLEEARARALFPSLPLNIDEE